MVGEKKAFNLNLCSGALENIQALRKLFIEKYFFKGKPSVVFPNDVFQTKPKLKSNLTSIKQ